MSQTITVPTGLNEGPAQPAQQQEQPAQEQPRPESGFVHGQYVPPSKRTTLHNTRLGAALAKNMEQQASTPAPAPQPQANDVMREQVGQLTTAIQLLAASQFRNMQQPSGAQERDAELERLRLHNQYGSGPYSEDSSQQWGGPDFTRFDAYDEQDVADFHRLNNDHIKQEVRRQVEAERAAQHKASEDERLHSQLDAAESRFKRDANYTETMQAAIHRAAQSGWKLPIEQAYLEVSNETEARSDRRRGSSYMPKDVKTLGEIVRYNQQTGRSGRQ